MFFVEQGKSAITRIVLLKFEDTKRRVISNRISKKDRQYNDKRRRRTDNTMTKGEEGQTIQ